MPRGIYERKVGKTLQIQGAIRSLVENGWSHIQVGKLFKVNPSTVARIIRGDWNPSRERTTRMQTNSLYWAICVKCGEEILSEFQEGSCEHCGGLFRLEWPSRIPGGARLDGKPEPTISEKEDLK